MIRTASPGDLAGIASLWNQAFPGDETFLKYYLERFVPDDVLVFSGNEGIVSMLHIIPSNLFTFDGPVECGYVFSVATHPDYRGKGIASAVVNEAHTVMKKRGMAASILVPKNEPLFDFYARLGYLPYFKSDLSSIPLVAAESNCRIAVYDDIAQMSSIYENSLKDRVHLSRTAEYWKILLDTEDCAVCLSADGVCGYCFFSDNEGLTVNELFTVSTAAELSLLAFLGGLSGKAFITHPCSTSSGRYMGMIKFFDGFELPAVTEQAPYMNMVFNT